MFKANENRRDQERDQSTGNDNRRIQRAPQDRVISACDYNTERKGIPENLFVMYVKFISAK